MALHVHDEMLRAPHGRLIADDGCCCPECEICADSMNRANNSDINAGAPVAYTGDVGSFYVSASAIRTATSNKLVYVCDGDRVTVAVRSSVVAANQAHVKLGGLTGTVVFGSAPKLKLDGGASGLLEIAAPAMSSTGGTWLTLCVGEYQGQIGVMLYSAAGNYRIFDTLGGTYDPNAGEFGTAGFGSGTIASGEVIFQALKVQHGKGDDELADCPECLTRPCFLCSDDLQNFPAVSETACGWSVTSGTWENGLTTVSYATLTASTVFTTGGPPTNIIITANIFFWTGGVGDTARIYLNGATGSEANGYFVELRTSSTGDPGCIRLMNGATELAAHHYFTGGFPTFVKVYFGDGIFAVGSPSNVFVEGLLQADIPNGQPVQPAVGAGAIDAASDGIQFADVTIYRHASGAWPYCEYVQRDCEVFYVPSEFAYLIPNYDPIDGACTFTTLAGHAYTDGNGEILFDEEDSWLRFNVPHPTGKPGGYAHFQVGGVVDFGQATQNAWRIGWNAGSGPPTDYVEVAWLDVDPTTLAPPARYCVYGLGSGLHVQYKLYLGGELAATSDPIAQVPTPGGWAGFNVKICVGEGQVRVWSDAAQCSGDIFNVGKSYGFGNEHWAVGVGAGPNGFDGPTGKFQFQFSRTYENSLPTEFGGQPAAICIPCQTSYCPGSICGDDPIVPRLMKVVLAGISCGSLNGVYFVPPAYWSNWLTTGNEGCIWAMRFAASGGYGDDANYYGGINVHWFGAALGTGNGVEVIIRGEDETEHVIYGRVQDLCSSFTNVDVPYDSGDGPCTFSGSTCTVTAIY
jgi:hypothetical protein